MAAPDIQTGASGLKVIAITFGGLIGFIGIALVIGYIALDEGVEIEDDGDTIFQRGLPSDFFWFDEDNPPPEVVEGATPSHLIVEDNEEEIERQEKAKKIARAKAARKRAAAAAKAKAAAKPKPRVESVEEMFGATTANNDTVEWELVDAMNKMRRGSGAAFVQNSDSGKFAEVVKSEDANWLEYGVGQDMASYPVDLKRTITADRNVPCILINEITSELEGKITCQVEENVYGAQGRFVLIPAGSKAIGYYAPLKKSGDRRLFAGWERIITPDGINITMSGNDKASGARLADAMGRAGITGDVDNKYFEKYGLAFMVATLNAVASAQYVASNANQQIVIENYGREISQLSNTILNSNINIKPVVTIPAGSRVLISPLVDIWFQKPKGSEIIAKTVPK